MSGSTRGTQNIQRVAVDDASVRTGHGALFVLEHGTCHCDKMQAPRGEMHVHQTKAFRSE